MAGVTLAGLHNWIAGATGVWQEGDTYFVDLAGTVRAVTDGEILAAARLGKIEELKTACQEAINGGFASSALGSPHTYESRLPMDQSNLIGAKLAGVDLDYTCIDPDGSKQQHFHTAAQIAQVFADGMTHMQAQKTKFYQKRGLVKAANSLADLDAIAW